MVRKLEVPSSNNTRPVPGNVINRPRKEIPQYGRDYSEGTDPNVMVSIKYLSQHLG